ncbi:hypothetical protein L915_05783 [Phytophthora nicotianae]|nr:hypothetical protein L915_05783 [Phytophthora nicotianae]
MNWRVLNELIILSNRQLEPENVTCDFEVALINAVLDQFPRANLVGCLFHWKQVLRRKMVDLRIPDSQIKSALGPGKLDSLAVIPVDQIAKKSVRYIRSIVDETRAKTKWNAFWKYFLKTWMERYDATTWNVQEMMRVGVDVINRTNNPLEKYNRDFASRMSTHPGLLAFIEGTKREAARYIRRIEDIKHLRQTASQHAPPAKLEIPEDYESFE